MKMVLMFHFSIVLYLYLSSTTTYQQTLSANVKNGASTSQVDESM